MRGTIHRSQKRAEVPQQDGPRQTHLLCSSLLFRSKSLSACSCFAPLARVVRGERSKQRQACIIPSRADSQPAECRSNCPASRQCASGEQIPAFTNHWGGSFQLLAGVVPGAHAYADDRGWSVGED